MYKKELEAKNVHWKKIVEEFESSGKSQTNYAKEHGLASHKLSYYRQKFKVQKPKQIIQKSPAFTPITVKEKVAKKNISNDTIDPSWLAVLIRELHAKS